MLMQIMKTEFVPKLVATVTVCCASYVVLAASDKIITVKTLASIGYFDALVIISFLCCNLLVRSLRCASPASIDTPIGRSYDCLTLLVLQRRVINLLVV